MNFLRQGFRKLASDRLTQIPTDTDRETDTIEIIYHAANSRVVNDDKSSSPVGLIDATTVIIRGLKNVQKMKNVTLILK